MEGIVRQTWAANPSTDIGFVYTVSEGLVKDLLTGTDQKHRAFDGVRRGALLAFRLVQFRRRGRASGCRRTRW